MWCRRSHRRSTRATTCSAAADPGRESTWLAASFWTSTACRPQGDRARAFLAPIARHGTLHSGFVRDGGRVVRHLHDPAALRVIVTPPRNADHRVGGARYALRGLRRPHAHRLAGPLPPRPSTAPIACTILCGFDHAHVDATDGHRRLSTWRVSTRVPAPNRAFDPASCRRPASSTTAPRRPAIDRDFPTSRMAVGRVLRPPRPPATGVRRPGLAPGARARRWMSARSSGRATPPPAASRSQVERLRRSCPPCPCSMISAAARRCPCCSRCTPGDPAGGELRWAGSRPTPRHDHRRDRPARDDRLGWAGGPRGRRAREIPIPRVLETIGSLAGRTDIFMVSYVDYRRLPAPTRTISSTPTTSPT